MTICCPWHRVNDRVARLVESVCEDRCCLTKRSALRSGASHCLSDAAHADNVHLHNPIVFIYSVLHRGDFETCVYLRCVYFLTAVGQQTNPLEFVPAAVCLYY